MANQLQTSSIDNDRLSRAIHQLINIDRVRFRRLWAYYQNPMRAIDALNDDRPYRQAQEWGLPARITGFRSSSDVIVSQRVDDQARKEVVIENDIAWRIETMAEYLFGKPLIIASAAPDADRRAVITDLLRQIVAVNGGMIFLQQLALLASVYGFIDVLVKLDTTKLRELPTEKSNRACHFSGKASDANLATEVASPAPDSCGDTQSLGRPPMDSPNDSSLTNSPTHSPSDAARSTDVSPAQQAPAPDAPAEALAASADPAASAEPSIDRVSANPVPNLASFARLIRFETIEPSRALPLLASNDFRVVEAYGQVYDLQKPTALPSDPTAEPRAWIDRLYRSTIQRLRPPLISFGGAEVRTVQVIELLTATTWQRYEEGKLVASGNNSLGQIPLVHIQNIALPFEYAGSSDVEPLIPLQDELNTRLSDRAHRITMQSFKMYLGKGIDDFTSMPVAPGRMWATDNVDAQVIEFGVDAANPSEESHIGEIREALDKTSGVSPVASGGVKNKLGHLTSAAALRPKPYRLKPLRRSKAKLARVGDAPTMPDSRRIFLERSAEWN